MRESSKNRNVRQQKYVDQSRLARFANRRFFETISELAAQVEFSSVLDAGCGEGISLDHLRSIANPSFQAGFDLDARRVSIAIRERAVHNLYVGNVQHIPMPSASVDLVLCLETLEHVGQPSEAVLEIARVTRAYALFSVPNEPWWRIGNMLRGKYLAQFGNTPGHINHWSIRGFRRLLEGNFQVLQIRQPVLWNFILARKSPGAPGQA